MTVPPEVLADRLAALEVEVETVVVEGGGFEVDGWVRPTGLVRVTGAGHTGTGEYVGFTTPLQAAFAAAAPRWLLPGRLRVGALPEAWPEAPGDPTSRPWARAAIEAALLDLALRQAGQSLADLAESPPQARLHRALSFDADPDPVARAARISANNPRIPFKIDVHPDWDAATLEALHAVDVAILDFKGRGDAALVDRVAIHGPPDALLEDPPVPLRGEARRTAFDQRITTPAAVPADGSAAFVNLKAPRMGGFLACLRALARARALGLDAYWGGMFEVDVGRKQARQLASLYTRSRPNDLALVMSNESAARPPGSGREPVIQLASEGFGG